MEQLLPGWTLNSIVGVAVGEDTNGSYAAAHVSGQQVQLKSSLIQSGVIDRAGQPDFRYFAVAYDIGAQTGSSLSGERCRRYADW
jgi:hypothetical protein